QLDTLILYGHANQFSFLNCNHQLNYLGIFYSNQNDALEIDGLYPNLNQEIWCFPTYTSVVNNKNIIMCIDELMIGDSILSIANNATISPTKINCIEYHFNIDTTINHLFTSD